MKKKLIFQKQIENLITKRMPSQRTNPQIEIEGEEQYS